MNDSTKEREILKVMRQVLGRIVRDTTPAPGMKHPLEQQTIEEIRLCFGLIAARERELADAAGIPQERPRFADEETGTKVVSLKHIAKADDSENR